MSKQETNLQKIYIYALKEKGCDKIKYIGKTNNIHRRLSEHIIESKKTNKYHKHKWINSVLIKNGKIEIEVLEEVDFKNWVEREKFWIDKIGLSNLTNHNIGGEGGRPPVSYFSYTEAKNWISNNKKDINTKRDWDLFCKSEFFPIYLPKCPEKVYRKEWKGYGDWLGTGKISNKNISNIFLDFKSSKKIISKFNINTQKEWMKFCKSGKKPINIPSNPQKTYKKEWAGWTDWLSSKKFSEKNKLSYNEAKKIVHSLELNTHKDWVEYFKNNTLEKIPFNPQRTYKEDWEGWKIWLGSKNKYIDYSEAKNIVKKLNLKSKREWFTYYDNNNLKKMPKHPQTVYSDNWEGWKFWLGK